jgi:hypothetical protein
MIPTGLILIQFAHNVMCPIRYIVTAPDMDQIILDVMHVVILIVIFVILPPGKLVEVVKVDMAFYCTLSEILVSKLFIEPSFSLVIILAHY